MPYMGTSVTAAEKRGAIVGLVNKYDDNGYEDFALAYEGKLHENYFTHPSMTAFNGYDVRGYRFSNWSPDIITTQFTDDTKSKVVEYNGISYIPKTGMKMTVEMTEGMTGDYILTLMLNGRTITASDGTYSIDIDDDEIAAIVSAKVEIKSLSGNVTETDPYVIASTPEWDFVAAKVKDGNTYRNKYLRLDADITVSQMVGTCENPLEGYFNGNNHTLMFNAGTENAPFDEDYCAPFRYYHSTSIKNLMVKGDVKSVLFVGEGNKLCHPSAENQQMKGFRAYFKLANWLVDNNVGDVNGDGNVSVNDIMAVVNVILGENEGNENVAMEKYDINDDGSISVSDVMALVHIVLNGGSGINNIVVNGADGITFDGNTTSPVAAGENHLWNE